jgi:hypothetical protein
MTLAFDFLLVHVGCIKKIPFPQQLEKNLWGLLPSFYEYVNCLFSSVSSAFLITSFAVFFAGIPFACNSFKWHFLNIGYFCHVSCFLVPLLALDSILLSL